MNVLRAFLVAMLFGVSPSSDATAAEKAGKQPPPPERSLSELFEGMSFRTIGPYRGGRSCAVAGVRGEPLTYYFGAAGGGVWKTEDGGMHWENVSDKAFKTGSVGAIDVAESDRNVVYVGMGEWTIRGNVSHGDGVYRSTDAGHTWTNVGLRSTYQIAKVKVHPKDPDTVYVAAQGHAWGPNEERGVFRTTDGGKTWRKVLYVDGKTGAADLAMDATNPRTLYAAMWEHVRRPWTMVSGGPGSGLYKSTDGGDTWTKLGGGLPEGPLGKIGVAVSASRPRRVYAIVEADKGGVYRSEDGGEKWTRLNDDHSLRERAWYYSRIVADPKNPDVVYVPNVSFFKSIDGGKSYAKVHPPYVDNHELWIDPDNPDRMILGNDGGATITFNGGRTWSPEDNQPTAQFYRVATDSRVPYWVYGSQQDNSNVAIPSGVPGLGIGRSDWHSVGGGESGWIAPDPKDPDVVYAGEYGGQITRYDHRTRQARQIMVWPQLADGHAARDLKYRFQWNAPILVSPNDPKVLYHASQILLRTKDEGETWEEMSPDLTRNDRGKQDYAGGPIARDNTGVEVYDTIFALAESPLAAGTIWAGSDDGLVHLTRDNGKTWANVTPKAMPEWIQVNSIDASRRDPGTAYLAATRYKLDDFKPYLYRTTDYGKIWTLIVSGIPDGAFTRVVREDPTRAGLLYAGTETGLYVSFDDGSSWKPFQRNLPATPVTDLAVKDSDLVVATQGRGFWILDDLTPLRQWSDGIARSAVHLFTPRPTLRMHVEKPDPDEPPPSNLGANMPAGVVVDYWLKDKPGDKDKLSLEFRSQGKLIRSFTSEKPKQKEDEEAAAESAQDKDEDKPLAPKAGLNRFVWDMRVLKPTLVPKAVFNEGTKEPPEVAPGSYEVRLTAGGQTLEAPIEVKPNPGVKATAADLEAQFALLAAIRDRLSETHETVLRVRDVRAQVKALADRAEKIGKAEALRGRAKALVERLTTVEEKLINPKIKADEDDLNYEPKLDHDFTDLAGIVASADARPTVAFTSYYDELAGRLRAILSELKEVFDEDLADFNRAVAEQGIPPVMVVPASGS